MFSDLMGKIFSHADAHATSQPTAASQPSAPQPAAASDNSTATLGATPEPPVPPPVDVVPTVPDPDAGTASATPPPQSVDVAAVLGGLAKKNPEHLDWKRSIVDMLKLLGMDSSLSARKELAKDLDYSGDTSDSAAMNEWLHKAVLQKLAENGGKVPAELMS